jgi:hypothetical protein
MREGLTSPIRKTPTGCASSVGDQSVSARASVVIHRRVVRERRRRCAARRSRFRSLWIPWRSVRHF